MKMRLLPILGITGLFSIALAGSAAAGGGGWPPAPGTYRATDTSANASLVGPSTIVCYPPKGCFPQPSAFADASIDRGLHTFKPRGSASLVQQTGTMLNLFLYNTVSGTSIAGCWIIADSDFTVAPDLSSASLSTTVPGESNCPGMPMKVSSTNLVTVKGGGGGGGGGTGPITLNLSWTYKGVVSHGRDDGMLTCGSFMTVGGFDSDHATATSQGQITGASATLTSQFASIDHTSTNQVVKGTPVDACFF
jgi:hypothetical protein